MSAILIRAPRAVQPVQNEALERALAERDTLVAFLHIYAELFAPALTRDPRFDALLARLNLSDVARTRA